MLSSMSALAESPHHAADKLAMHQQRIQWSSAGEGTDHTFYLQVPCIDIHSHLDELRSEDCATVLALAHGSSGDSFSRR